MPLPGGTPTTHVLSIVPFRGVPPKFVPSLSFFYLKKLHLSQPHLERLSMTYSTHLELTTLRRTQIGTEVWPSRTSSGTVHDTKNGVGRSHVEGGSQNAHTDCQSAELLSFNYRSPGTQSLCLYRRAFSARWIWNPAPLWCGYLWGLLAAASAHRIDILDEENSPDGVDGGSMATMFSSLCDPSLFLS